MEFKHLVTSLFFTLYFLSLVGCNSSERGENKIVDLAFTDATLKACIRANASKKGWQKVSEMITLNCDKEVYPNIGDPTGIEQLDHLQELTIENSRFRRIDLANLDQLTHLQLVNHQLREIDLSNQTLLTELNLGLPRVY